MGISENLKILRERHNLSQEMLAEIAGVTDKAVSTWETGKSEPRMGAIQKIADYFGMLKSNLIEDGGMDGIDSNGEIGKRLKKIRALRQKTVYSVCSELNISKDIYLQYEYSGKAPDRNELIKLAQYYNVPVEYILNGNAAYEKEIFANTELDYEQQYNMLDNDFKRKLTRLNDNFKDITHKLVKQNILYNKEHTEKITLASKKLGLKKIGNKIKSIIYLDPFMENKEFRSIYGIDSFFTINLPENLVPMNAAFAFKISDSAMEPYYKNGTIIFTDSSYEVDSGEIGVFYYEGKFICRILNVKITQNVTTTYLKVSNRQFQDTIVGNQELITLGRVVGKLPFKNN